jgi:ppGpp synthetase/RelA/SpoT-type nucleotidyltranferase
MKKEIGIRQMKLIDEMVEHYIQNKGTFSILLDGINSFVQHSDSLKRLIHSSKSRIKDPTHLKDKLIRKVNEANEAGRAFDITKDNLFSKINDLAGFRILHLHTTQFAKINAELNKIFKEQKWKVIEGPNARTWDDETRNYFKSIGVETSVNPNMYTSVHYLIKPNKSYPGTCELQVRTLMEEVWGEVDHTINYPHKSDIHSCREQIKTLARVTSSCSRLVDSIFSTYEHELQKKETIKPKVKSVKKTK